MLGHRLSIEVGASLEEVDQTLSLLRTILLSCIPLVLIVATAGGWWISSRALRPVDLLTAAAEAIGMHDLSRRLPLPVPETNYSAWQRHGTGCWIESPHPCSR